MSDSRPALEVHDLGKLYRIGLLEERPDTLAGTLLGWLRAPSENLRRLRRLSSSEEGQDSIWALRDVSFEVERGQAIAVIGHNGAGKSTLLKILSRITLPTEGRAILRGRVGSLLEVGTGFHGDLTGRENTYLNGAILGMKRREIDRKFDDIVSFAGVEKFVDTPVKRYSSGMYLRLAFAVAAHLETEILLVDEVLAVGDFQFQKRCLGKMDDIANQGRTVIFVSHNLAAVSTLCERAILLNHGRVRADGPVREVIDEYLQAGGELTAIPLGDRRDRGGDGRFRFLAHGIRNLEGDRIDHLASGQGCELTFDYETDDGEPVDRAIVQIIFRNTYDQPVASCLSRVSRAETFRLPPTGRLVCRIPRLPLLPGTYSIDLWCKIDESVADQLRPALSVNVVSGDYFGTGRLPSRAGGDVVVDHEWALEA